MKPTRAAARVAALVLLAIAVTGALARTIPTGWLPAVEAAAVSPYLLAAAPVAAGTALAARSRPVAVVALLATVLAVAVELPLYVPSGGPAAGKPVTVLTANLRHGRADPQALLRRVRAEHVDVLSVEELTRAEAARLQAAGLGKLLPHHALRIGRDTDGVGVWSRYGISAVTPLPGFRLGALTAELAVRPGFRVRMVAVHVTAPVVDSARSWTRDLDRLRQLLASGGPGAVLVAGDFNATYDNARFRALLGGGYHASCEQAGAGLCRSFPADDWYPPVIGIDHVLARGMRAVSARTVAVAGSDHRGLLVTLRPSR